MRIQVIQYATRLVEKDGLVFTPLKAPRALDDFDINIVSLSEKSLWTYYGSNCGKVDSLCDLITIEQMISNRKRALVIYVLPQNIDYTYNLQYSSSCYTSVLKDMLAAAQVETIDIVIPYNIYKPRIMYEKTETGIDGEKYDADFYFASSYDEVVTRSDKSEKPTTVMLDSRTYATTLDVTKTTGDLKHFIFSLFDQHKHIEVPEWMRGIYFCDDIAQQNIIDTCNEEIEIANAKINIAQAKLEENAKIKSILYTNGNQLVEVVFEILEKLLSCDLTEFVDEKKEDFLIKCPQCTFIGEIKGVTSNIKYEHISQLELHYRGYLDKLADEKTSESVKQILIMNPFRSKPIEQREPVHTEQIKLAERNGCLIIETRTLLRMYEKYCSKQLTSQQCENIFRSYTGLLRESDFEEMTAVSK